MEPEKKPSDSSHYSESDLFGKTNFAYRLTDSISQVPPPSFLDMNRKTIMLETIGESAASLGFYPDYYKDMCFSQKLPKLEFGSAFAFFPFPTESTKNKERGASSKDKGISFADEPMAPLIHSPEEKRIKDLPSILHFMGVNPDKVDTVLEMKDDLEFKESDETFEEARNKKWKEKYLFNKKTQNNCMLNNRETKVIREFQLIDMGKGAASGCFQVRKGVGDRVDSVQLHALRKILLVPLRDQKPEGLGNHQMLH